MNKSVFNLNENIAAALAYVLSFVSGFIILIVEKDNKFVRFHAMQSVLLGVILFILNAALNIISHIWLVGFIASIALWALGIITFALWLFTIFKALSKEYYKLPIIGDVAHAQVGA